MISLFFVIFIAASDISMFTDEEESKSYVQTSLGREEEKT